MPTQVIGLFVAFVLLWCGFGTIESPSGVAAHTPDQQHTIAQAGGLSTADAAPAVHDRLSDLPSQAQYEPPTETPGLLPGPLGPRVRSMLTAAPHALVSASAPTPFLAGPLRPPCSARFAG